jgi:O-antigen ligase
MTPDSPATSPSTSRRRPGAVAAAVVAWLAMVPVGFFYAASGLVVPGPYLFLMWAAYVVLLVVAVLLTRSRSYWVLAVPVVGGALWWVVVSAGERYLDWTG